MREIVIDLTQRNDVKKYKDSNLFQYEALTQCEQMLDDTASIDYSKCDNISNCRTHNTIFISGGRGSGKTVFLINMENSELLTNRTKFKFIQVIDPTLLHDGCEIASCESFIAVILGRIDEEVSSEINKNEAKNREATIRNEYSKKLKGVADALADMKNSSDESGFDAIYGKASALRLEQYIHEYLQFISDYIFDERIILLRIDDIDMAFTHGFKVLEVVRRYLASPYVQTVVTGDYELYQNIVEKKFKSEISVYDDEKEKDKQETKKLADKYLLKILPADRRVRLQTVEEIFTQNRISVILGKNTKDNDSKIDYFRLKGCEDNFFNNWVRRKEYKNNLLNIMDSVRKQIMLLEKMQTWYYKTIHGFGGSGYLSGSLFFSNINDREFFSAYRDMQNRLQSFFGSVTDTSDMRITYIQDNLDAIIETSEAAESTEYFSHEILLNKINERLIADNSDINSDFPREAGSQYLFIAKRVEDKKYHFPAILKSCSSETKLIAALFGFDNYYFLQSHRVPILLIAGRFIQYIFTTFNLPPYVKSVRVDCNPLLYRNLNATPLFIGAVPQKVYLDRETPEDYETENNEKYNSDSTDREEESGYPYGLTIADIKSIFEDFSDLNEMTNFSQKYFIDSNFMNQVLDRFYNNLSLYIRDKSIKTNNLLEYAQRVAIMLLNAIAACEKSDLEKVSYQNIALSKTFGKDELSQSDSFRINIKSFITPTPKPSLVPESTPEQEKENKIAVLSHAKREMLRKSSITYRVANHFLMRIILGDIITESLTDKLKNKINKIHDELNDIKIRSNAGGASDAELREWFYRSALSNSKKVEIFIKNLIKFKDAAPLIYQTDVKGQIMPWTKKIRVIYDQANEEQKKQITELTGYKG